MGQNQKFVGPELKVYEQRIIFKINLNGKIVLYVTCPLSSCVNYGLSFDVSERNRRRGPSLRHW